LSFLSRSRLRFSVSGISLLPGALSDLALCCRLSPCSFRALRRTRLLRLSVQLSRFLNDDCAKFSAIGPNIPAPPPRHGECFPPPSSRPRARPAIFLRPETRLRYWATPWSRTDWFPPRSPGTLLSVETSFTLKSYFSGLCPLAATCRSFRRYLSA